MSSHEIVKRIEYIKFNKKRKNLAMTFLTEDQVQHLYKAIYTDLEIQVEKANIKDKDIDEVLEALKNNIRAKLCTMTVEPYEKIKEAVMKSININKILE